MKNYANNYIQSIYNGLKKSIYKVNGESLDSETFFNELINLTKNIQQKKGRLFFFGNGASASFSNHMALDWSKNGGILAFSLSDSSMLTALANDYDFEGCFLEFLKINQPTSNDLIITTSSSGNSPNVVNVLNYCFENNIKTFGLSGLNQGNKTEKLADYSLFVPMRTYGMVECIHQVFHHLMLDKHMEVEEWAKKESQNMDAKNFKL
jgi:D-sedoheptulose 7-phosphate isomerase